LKSSGFAYLLQVWNYLDLIPPLFIVTILVFTLFSDIFADFPFLYTIHAIANILMWFKLLYFLRIFKSTGYLVRMIIQVVVDMRIFIVVLCIIFFGFADAFVTLSLGSSDSEDAALNG